MSVGTKNDLQASVVFGVLHPSWMRPGESLVVSLKVKEVKEHIGSLVLNFSTSKVITDFPCEPLTVLRYVNFV